MRALVIAFLAFVMVLPTVAQTVSVVQENIANSGPTYYFHQRKVARTTKGVLIAAWNDKNAAGGQVIYSMYDDAFGTWSPAAAVSNAGDRAIQPALASDELGNVHAVWQQRETATPTQYQTYYARFNGASWTVPVKISVNDAETAEEAAIEVDSRGHFWVAYNNDGAGVGKEFVMAIKSTDGGSSWSTTPDTLYKTGTLGTSIEVGRTSLAAGPDGRMVAIWDNSLTGTMPRREVFVNQYDGSAWQEAVRISDTSSVDRDHNRYTSIAMDAQSNIYAFYTLSVVSGTDPRLRKILLHKKAWLAKWTLPETAVLESDTISFMDISAVVDSAQVIHVTYRRDIKADTLGLDETAYTFSKDGGATWAPRVVVSRPKHDAGYATIANRVRRAYGIDILLRESQDENVGDQSTTAVVYANIPYSFVTSVSEEQIPVGFNLLANYPNPFNPSTTIAYDVAVKGQVTLTIYDMLGREVRTLVNDVQDGGRHEMQWDGRSNLLQPVTSGVYMARLTTGAGARTLSIMLLK
ncbi:MAG TPA: T9SS type A sorting domain-containing protein [Bacteroidota bacterium]|nr:T9SS type A sorting domain-containing protein [Bacteroidota bacterium]